MVGARHPPVPVPEPQKPSGPPACPFDESLADKAVAAAAHSRTAPRSRFSRRLEQRTGHAGDASSLREEL